MKFVGPANSVGPTPAGHHRHPPQPDYPGTDTQKELS